MANAKAVRMYRIGERLSEELWESRQDDVLRRLGQELMRLSTICVHCGGEDDDCPACAGSGVSRESQAREKAKPVAQEWAETTYNMLDSL
ncbi:hypothetical protein C6380_28105 [Pseudomonas syringae pv. actinidiae]|nr:hypothetical protein BUE60_28200 [Pseudomonas syringae pv. actinidiae]PBK48733.1 hypothetical protein BUE61_25155 [Pseudomonas syringae pv. actinidiae]RJX47353.1 hypothetical protein C6380_28105 [Pseudomonas syringae pv. actinidiae]RJX52653.1 hypothetical protein C6383_29155 [Pseudomonas syringae pv. actinidiae]RJX52935.1 hypothetical protein C6379_18605 [Pseudomonas syringae pv. actinidiae]